MSELEVGPCEVTKVGAFEVPPFTDEMWLRAETRFPGISSLLKQIRKHLAGTDRPFSTAVSLPYDAAAKAQLYLTLFQDHQTPLRWGTTVDLLSESLDRILRRLRDFPSFSSFAAHDPLRTRILLEYTTGSRPVPSVDLLAEDQIGPYRFEPGITGLRFRAEEKPVFYMPTEAFTRSHMSLDQVFQYLARRLRIKEAKASVAIRAAKSRMSSVQLIESRAFLSSGQEVLELYRGYPKRNKATRNEIEASLSGSVDWIVRNQKPSGKFLYFYDPATDSTADFQHPKNPDYYNILRHSGGTITLLRAYELWARPAHLEAARRSLEYLIEHSNTYERDGRTCRYVFDNRKAKLGGTGVGLVALMHWFRLTGDRSYLTQSAEMVEHLLSQIDADGEFIGYYIHPLFNGGRPLENVSDEDKRKLFSFYYPGEALLGLALYEKHVPIDEHRRSVIRAAGRRALDFLVHTRPKRYPDLFLSLPADGWLMQAIEEWWSNPEMRDPSYSDFVFGDAQQMIAYMYNEMNSPYPDYVGQFFYWHGQHAIPDGSRAEGLIAAYILAREEGRTDLQEQLLNHCRMAAAGLLHTYNSPESTYSAVDSARASHAFRFKLTRQWVRVDSIQHTACFFARFLPYF